MGGGILKTPRLFYSTLLFLGTLISLHASALEVNGAASYSELGGQLFIGALMLETPTGDVDKIYQGNQERVIEIRFSNSMSKRRWAQFWTQSIAINSSRENMVIAADELSEILSAFQSGLEQGDHVLISYHPLYGTSASVNGTTLVKEKSATVFNLFLSSWLGPVPPSSHFKNAILGTIDSTDNYSNFQALTPSEQRITVVKSWGDKLKAAEEQAIAEAAAEQEAIEKAEQEALKKAEGEALAEQQRLELVEEEKRKAQEAARKAAAEQTASREAERLAALEKQKALDAQKEGADEVGAEEEEEEHVDLSVESILAQQDYTSQIIGMIYKSVSYPNSAVKRNQQGSVRAEVIINRDGSVSKMTIIEESNFKLLNQAVLSAIKKAAPFPPLPNELKMKQLELVVPVAFKLN